MPINRSAVNRKKNLFIRFFLKFILYCRYKHSLSISSLFNRVIFCFWNLVGKDSKKNNLNVVFAEFNGILFLKHCTLKASVNFHISSHIMFLMLLVYLFFESLFLITKTKFVLFKTNFVEKEMELF
jgi:hypothetical protein